MFVFWMHMEMFLGDPSPAGIWGAGLERAGRSLTIPSFIPLAEHSEGCSASSSLLVRPPLAFWDGPGWRRQFLVSLGLSKVALGSVTITQPGWRSSFLLPQAHRIEQLAELNSFYFPQLLFRQISSLTCLPSSHIYGSVGTEWGHSSTPKDKGLALGSLLLL